MIRNALVLFCYVVLASSAPAYGRAAMKFLNSLIFTGMPDLGQYGFMSNHIIYGNVWNGVAVVPDANGNNLPNEAGTRQIIRSIIASGYRGLVQWDIEGIGWDWDPRWHPNTYQQGIANFQKILAWSKDEAKGVLRIGNYYFPPHHRHRPDRRRREHGVTALKAPSPRFRESCTAPSPGTALAPRSLSQSESSHSGSSSQERETMLLELIQ